jgi:hypothetical protein
VKVEIGLVLKRVSRSCASLIDPWPRGRHFDPRGGARGRRHRLTGATRTVVTALLKGRLHFAVDLEVIMV